MRPFSSTIPFDEALRRLLDAAVPIESVERLDVAEADGRVAATDVIATGDVPAFDRAAMDGYAVVASDTAGASVGAPRSLACVDRLFTGLTPRRGIGSGECIEIATGAPMPPGADAVVMVEDTATPDRGSTILVRAAVAAGQHVGRRGADLRQGGTVIGAGQTLAPSRIGALAATGVTTVDVYRKPSVAVLSTGNEIAPPGRPLAPGEVYDINRFTVAAVVRRHGGVAAPLAPAGDTLTELTRALDTALAHDLIVFSGGSSVGERDLLVDLVHERGEIVFHGIAVKPGKPTLFARIAGKPFLGLPGYPASCLSNAYMLLVPFLRRMARLPEWRPVSMELPLGRRVSSAPGRHQFYTVRVIDGRAEPAFKASGDITSMASADGFIEIPAEVEAVEAGTTVRVKLF